jgi:hypothetical protein
MPGQAQVAISRRTGLEDVERVSLALLAEPVIAGSAAKPARLIAPLLDERKGRAAPSPRARRPEATHI